MSDSSQNKLKIKESLQNALLTSTIVLVLAFPIVGMRTVDQQAKLIIQYEWERVGILVLAAFIGRFIVNVIYSSGAFKNISFQILPKHSKTWDKQHLLIALGSVLVVFSLLLPVLPFSSRYVIDVAILALTYVMLGWGLNVVVGLAGLLDLGYAGFYAVGAYGYALLAQYFDFTFWQALPIAGLFAAFSGLLLGFPVLRLRGDYLAIVTLGFGEIIRVVLLNWYDLTNGPDGVSGIPRPSFFGLEFKRRVREGETFHEFFGLEYSPIHRLIFLYYVILILALLVNFLTIKLRKLPAGRAWEALREDEIACRSLGVNPTNTKLTAFALGATFAGFGGAFFATKQGFISPESFTFIESAIILAIVVLGGMGSQLGVAIAAIVLIGGTELFRELEEYRMLTFGLLMVVMMVWKPTGFVGKREPSIKLKI